MSIPVESPPVGPSDKSVIVKEEIFVTGTHHRIPIGAKLRPVHYSGQKRSYGRKRYTKKQYTKKRYSKRRY